MQFALCSVQCTVQCTIYSVLYAVCSVASHCSMPVILPVILPVTLTVLGSLVTLHQAGRKLYASLSGDVRTFWLETMRQKALTELLWGLKTTSTGKLETIFRPPNILWQLTSCEIIPYDRYRNNGQPLVSDSFNCLVSFSSSVVWSFLPCPTSHYQTAASGGLLVSGWCPAQVLYCTENSAVQCAVQCVMQCSKQCAVQCSG